MKSRHDYSTLNIQGLNIDKLINEIRQDGVVLYDINRLAYNNVKMIVNNNDINNISEKLDNQTLIVENTFGIITYIKNFLKRIGLIIGVVLSIALIIFLSMYTLHIEIIGLDTIDRQTVLSVLNEYGIYKYKINKYDKDDLESFIMNNIEGISLISTKKIGTTLVINVKEKSSQIEENATHYVSPYNMIILDYQVYSGVSNINKGNMVKVGDVLIYPEEYIDEDGVLHLISPKAIIKATIWHTATYTFMKEETIYKPTGQSVTNFEYRIGKHTIYKKEKSHNYQYFDTKHTNQIISNNIVPISLSKTIYIETTPEVVKNDFEKSKDKIIANLNKVVYNKLSDNESVVDTIVDIKELDDRYIVNVYLECSAVINVG